MFLTFEGIEGCGKSTQARRLVASIGPRAVFTHEPGGTVLGQGVRTLLLHPGAKIAPEAELLLYAADRAQHVAEVIRPALAEGRIVVCDRYIDSTTAYQGHGRGLPPSLVSSLMDAATGGLRPDLTVLLDVSVDVGLARVGKRGSRDRMETESTAFHQRVRFGYLEIARDQPDRFVLVDGEGDPDDVEERIRQALSACGVRAGGDGVR